MEHRSIMLTGRSFSTDILKLDCNKVTEEITAGIHEVVFNQLRRKGVVVALSGGVDSSVVGALCVRALGADRVIGLLMPEKESSSETLRLSHKIVEHLGIRSEYRDITPVLEAVGCYHYRAQAIQSVVSEFEPECKCKIVLPSILEKQRYSIFSVIVSFPDGRQTKARLTSSAYLQIVAASNFKQRVRKMLEYYHADRLNFAVTGTPNRLEYDQGFFVKLGDGTADIKPIAHLYKTQVYQLAEFLGIPAEIVERPPTTDTYSMPQSQEEFYFSVPYHKMDLCLYGKNHNIPAADVALASDLDIEQVERIYRDIDDKRKATCYQHKAPILIRDVQEVSC